MSRPAPWRLLLCHLPRGAAQWASMRGTRFTEGQIDWIQGLSPMAQHSSDRNLLFGILALQMDFISRDALVAAMNAWVLDKAKNLGQILLEQGALRSDAQTL